MNHIKTSLYLKGMLSPTKQALINFSDRINPNDRQDLHVESDNYFRNLYPNIILN